MIAIGNDDAASVCPVLGAVHTGLMAAGLGLGGLSLGGTQNEKQETMRAAQWVDWSVRIRGSCPM